MGSYTEGLTAQLEAFYGLQETEYTLKEQIALIPDIAKDTKVAVRLGGEIEELRQILAPLENELREGLQLLVTDVQKIMAERGEKMNVGHDHNSKGRLEYQITGEGNLQSQLVSFQTCDNADCLCYMAVNPHPTRMSPQSMKSEDLIGLILANRVNGYMHRGLSRILET